MKTIRTAYLQDVVSIIDDDYCSFGEKTEVER